MIDALLEVAARPYSFTDAALDAVTAGERRVVTVTAHRRENWGEPLRRICAAIRELAQSFADVQVVFQMHKNPDVRNIIQQELGHEARVLLVEPQEYVPWINLMKRSTLLLTDSGGIQEEAPALGKPVLVMRETTERPEGIAAGTALLVGTDVRRIVDEASRLLTDARAYEAMSRAANPYGDGAAAPRIRAVLENHFAGRHAGRQEEKRAA